MKLVSSIKTQEIISLTPKCLANRLRGNPYIPTVSKHWSTWISSHLRMSKQEKKKKGRKDKFQEARNKKFSANAGILSSIHEHLASCNSKRNRERESRLKQTTNRIR